MRSCLTTVYKMNKVNESTFFLSDAHGISVKTDRSNHIR